MDRDRHRRPCRRSGCSGARGELARRAQADARHRACRRAAPLCLRRGRHRAGEISVRVARLHGVSWRRRRRTRRRQRSEGDVRPFAEHQPGPRQRRQGIYRGRLGARDPARRIAAEARALPDAEQGLQPAHRRRSRRDHRVCEEPSPGNRRGRDGPPAVRREGALCGGRGQGRRRRDRPRAAAAGTGRRNDFGGPRGVCREDVHGMPRRRALRRQDSRFAAGLAAGRQPDAGHRQRDGAVSERRRIRLDAAQRQTSRRSVR